MQVTFFENVFGRDLTSEDLALDELFDRIQNTRAPSKSALPLLKLAQFGSKRTPPDPTNPNKGNSLRHDANVVSVSGIEVDYDGEEMPFQEAVDRLEAADIAFIAYTSPSHTAAKPRWRVLCSLSKPHPPADRARYVDWINGLLGGALSRESWASSQIFYFGGINGPPAEMYLGDSERCIDEADFQATAQPFTAKPGAGGAGKGGKPDFDAMTEQELFDVIRSGAHYWAPSNRLLMMWAKQGITQADAEANLTGLFDQVPPGNRGGKWGKYRKRIPQWVEDAYTKALKISKTPGFLKLLAAIDSEPHWRRAIVTNTFNGRVEVCAPWPPQPGQVPANYRELTDADPLELLVYFLSNGAPFARKSMMWDIIMLVASRTDRHPVREAFKSLKWDSATRVHRLFFDYFPAGLPELPEAGDIEGVEHYNAIFKYYEQTALCFMVSVVARIMQPGCKVDTLPCLVGPQGWGKSRGLHALVLDPAWFSDDLSTTVGDRDAKELMVGKSIIELAEFPHVKKEIDRVKAFFSRQTDRYRQAYGRASGDHSRQCVFVASANELVLIDFTGNRRIWPVPLDTPVDVAKIIADREQLWAEAVHLYDQGFEWWLPPSLEAIASELQDLLLEEDTFDERILDFLDRRYPLKDPSGRSVEREPFTIRAVLVGIGYSNTPGDLNYASKSDENRAAQRLRRLGYQPNPHRPRDGKDRGRTWVARAKTRQ